MYLNNLMTAEHVSGCLFEVAHLRLGISRQLNLSENVSHQLLSSYILGGEEFIEFL